MNSPANRVLSLEGASNFRDLGGYRTLDGRTLRWRRLFRSDHLGAVTEADRERLSKLGLARAFDFRGQAEGDALPWPLPALERHRLIIEPVIVQRMQAIAALGRRITVPGVVAMMNDLYRALVIQHTQRYAAFLSHLADAHTPAVFHCTAGKDRTGVAAALLLFALGVPRDTVMQDYLLTNDVYRHPPIASDDPHAEVLKVLWSVRPEFLENALSAIDTQAGGVDRYLSERLGVDAGRRRALAAAYLE